MNKDQQLAVRNDELPPIREVTPRAVLRWIRHGWRDMREAGWPSLLHGCIVVAGSLVIVEIAMLFWPLLPGAASGFLVMGPILATGLYALSRRLEQGEPTRVRDAVDAWRRSSGCLLRFGLLLVMAATLWVGVSMLLFHFFVDADIERPRDLLRYVILLGEDTFLEWVLLAGLVSALMFAVSVVSVPLLVDREVTLKTALFTSLRAVGENPVAMSLWAIFLLLATALSIATLMLGFLILYPLMGHASWHVYRDVVDVSGLPARSSSE